MSDPRYTILFGAGASKDAGLPDAFELTEEVYGQLRHSHPSQARLFSVIVSKLILKGARRGASPFVRVNVEEVYDALKRLTKRDLDPLSEFVSGWDPALTGSTGLKDAEHVIRAILSPVQLTTRRRFDGGPSVKLDGARIRDAAAKLRQALSADGEEFQGASLQPFLDTLIRILDVEEIDADYMDHFLSEVGARAECLATLNYDRLVERSLEKRNKKFDLGISQWNQSRYVKFHGKSIKLIKLHGSVDWKIRGQDEIELKSGPSGYYEKSGMIFGGQSDKLVPNGPFLHLRHEFYKFLRRSSNLVVVGYSYADDHLNALIRSWASTRRNGKLINVDPGGFRGHGKFYADSPQGSPKADSKSSGVRVAEIRKGFAASIEDIIGELRGQPH